MTVDSYNGLISSDITADRMAAAMPAVTNFLKCLMKKFNRSNESCLNSALILPFMLLPGFL